MTQLVMTNKEAIFGPPLELPLKLVGYGGLLGMDRYRDTLSYDSRTYQWYEVHTGLDLRGAEGDPVFAARHGWVVEINNTSGDVLNRRIFIRHSPCVDKTFVTKYQHVKNVQVSIGDEIQQGKCIAEVGQIDGNDAGHLHFEIRLINSAGCTSYPEWDNRNTEPLDPWAFLYRWDQIYDRRRLGHEPSFGSRRTLEFISFKQWGGVLFFEVKQKDGDWYYLPLRYIDEETSHMIETLREAFYHGTAVKLSHRDSEFFGLKIIEEVRCGGRL